MARVVAECDEEPPYAIETSISAWYLRVFFAAHSASARLIFDLSVHLIAHGSGNSPLRSQPPGPSIIDESLAP